MKTGLIAIISAITLSLGGSANASAASQVPKKGDCYYVSASELDARNAISTSIPCKFSHNLETYFVGRLSGNVDPNGQSDSALLSRVRNTCIGAWPFPRTSSLNYFAFYVPTKPQWKSGARWVRCDAGIDKSNGVTSPVLLPWSQSAVVLKGNVSPIG